MGRLNQDNVCAWRAGCEHRVLQHEAVMARLTGDLALLDRLPCGHTAVDHDGMIAAGLSTWQADAAEFMRQMREGYGPE